MAIIKFTTGNILHADAEALVNTVNCVGVMGRGIALQFKNEFPANFKAYRDACARKEVQPGKMFVFETLTFTNPKFIINFPTKRHWRGKSRMEDIESGLKALVKEIRARNIRTIGIPPLGSGLGGLNWSEVRVLIVSALESIKDFDVTVFEPINSPVVTKSRDVPDMTPGRAALVSLVHRYLGGLMDPFVTLLEVHKLMYFMQEAGEPLKLKYAKAAYGPYAENLRHVLNAIEGHFVSGYADGGDAPAKQIELVPGAVNEAEAFLHDRQETVARFERVGDLVEGFETPFGLELLATVHWVANNENANSAQEAVERVYAWGERKKRFSSRQIGIAFQILRSKGWLEEPGSWPADRRRAPQG